MIAARQVSFKQVTSPAVKRTRVVKTLAVHQGKQGNLSAAVAAAATAVLLVSSPAFAAPLVNPQAELATNPVAKVIKKAKDAGPPKGVSGPEVQGQWRANPEKARKLALDNSPAASPEAEFRAKRE